MVNCKVCNVEGSPTARNSIRWAWTCTQCRNKRWGACTFEDCKNNADGSKGLCSTHRRAGTCSIEGCTTKQHAQGVCRIHYSKARRQDPNFGKKQPKEPKIKKIGKQFKEGAGYVHIEPENEIVVHGDFKKVTINARDLGARAKIPFNILPRYLNSLKQDKLISDFKYDSSTMLYTIFVPAALDIVLFSGLDQKPDGIFED